MTKVYKDSLGKIVNIGEWDYATHTDYDDEGNSFEITMNPMPDGLIESDEKIITGWDGGLYVEGDPRAEGS